MCLFPNIRDNSLNAASRDSFNRELKFYKMNYEFDKITRQTEDASLRRFLVKDLIDTFPEVDIDYEVIMGEDLLTLCAVIENKKVGARMDRAVRRI